MTDIKMLEAMIRGLESNTAYSRLEPLMPTIDRKIKEGVRRADIHEIIIAHGIEISADTFYTYLWRYRKRNSGTAKPVKPSSHLTSPVFQSGDSEAVQVDQDEKEATTFSMQPSLTELLRSEKVRDKIAEQFMKSRPPLFRKNK